MEQCTEKFAFVDTFMTGKSAPLVQRGMLCGKKQDIHEKVENLGPTHCFLCGKEMEAVGEISMAKPVVVTCCAAPDRNMARKTEVMESKKMSETQQD